MLWVITSNQVLNICCSIPSFGIIKLPSFCNLGLKIDLSRGRARVCCLFRLSRWSSEILNGLNSAVFIKSISFELNISLANASIHSVLLFFIAKGTVHRPVLVQQAVVKDQRCEMVNMRISSYLSSLSNSFWNWSSKPGYTQRCGSLLINNMSSSLPSKVMHDLLSSKS